MPPKPEKLGDIMQTMELIRNFWPDFTINKDDLLHPTKEFIIRFYRQFLSEINEKTAFALSEDEINFDDPVSFSKHGEEVYLFSKVATIYKRMNCAVPCLMDFYNPTPKRTHTFIKLANHFIVYVNNFIDDVSQIVAEDMGKLKEVQHLGVLKQDLLQINGENAVNIARSEDELNSLKRKLEEVQEVHENMLKEKFDLEKKSAQAKIKISSLTNECENLDYKLFELEREERELEEQFVSEEDFEQLKATEKYLQMEQEQLTKEQTESENHGKGQSVIVHLEKNLQFLKDLDFNSLRSVKKLQMHKDKEISLQNSVDQLNKHSLSQFELAANNLTDVNNLGDTLKGLAMTLSEKQNENNASLKNIEEEYANKIGECNEAQVQSEKIKIEIDKRNEEIVDLSLKLNKFDECVNLEMKRVWVACCRNRNAFENLINTLKKAEECHES